MPYPLLSWVWEMLWGPDEEPPSEGVSKGFLAEASLQMCLKIKFGGLWRGTKERVSWKSGTASVWTQRNEIPQLSWVVPSHNLGWFMGRGHANGSR